MRISNIEDVPDDIPEQKSKIRKKKSSMLKTCEWSRTHLSGLKEDVGAKSSRSISLLFVLRRKISSFFLLHERCLELVVRGLLHHKKTPPKVKRNASVYTCCKLASPMQWFSRELPFGVNGFKARQDGVTEQPGLLC